MNGWMGLLHDILGFKPYPTGFWLSGASALNHVGGLVCLFACLFWWAGINKSRVAYFRKPLAVSFNDIS